MRSSAVMLNQYMKKPSILCCCNYLPPSVPPRSSLMSSGEQLGIAERVYGVLPLFRYEQVTDRPIGYRPNTALAIVAAIIYGIGGVALLVRLIRSKAWWGLCLPIGSFRKANSPGFP